MAEVTMPRLSDSMEEGTIVRWLKSDGDEVSQGEEIVEIETDKATMTYEADEAGTLEIVAEEGKTLPIGEVIARIGAGGGGGKDGEAPAEEPEPASEDGEEEQEETAREEDEQPEEEAQPAEEQEPQPAASGDGGDPVQAEGRERPGAPSGNGGEGQRVKASPVAKRMARELKVDLGALSGSGPGGRIVKADVEAAAKGDGDGAAATEERAPAQPAEEPGKAKGDVTVEELSRTQQLIARRMAESKATQPDFQLTMEIDMEEAVGLRARLKQMVGEDEVAPSLNDVVVNACALALREHPRVNGSYRDGSFELHSRVNVGVAVATDEALVVPTIFDADRKSLGDIARTAHDLSARVRDKKVKPNELSGGTFTVSNLGMYGIASFTAVINPPQAAILAVGAVEPRVVVVDDKILSRNRMSVTLACDHRILYGADAAEFLGRVRDLLQEPLGLAL